MNQFWDGTTCLWRSNYPCVNGGEPKDAEDSCSCPPYFTGPTCVNRMYIKQNLLLLIFVDVFKFD